LLAFCVGFATSDALGSTGCAMTHGFGKWFWVYRSVHVRPN
jgi:hypothetical protein